MLSDGEDKGRQIQVQDFMKYYHINSCFNLFCFGYGTSHDPKLMNDIAKLKGGNFYSIEKLENSNWNWF